MHRRARIVVLAATAAVLLSNSAFSQALSRPTPAPLVTAENEAWYLDGRPITYAGNLYYPGGAQVFFSPNEMVRSGYHLGIPLYTRTTIEPFSIVYVPVTGGRMQPYERRRDGELTGTAGSTPSALITTYDPASAAGLLPQAPAPPSATAGFPAGEEALATTGSSDIQPGAVRAAPVGTAGAPATRSGRPHTRIGGRPAGLNAVFVEIGGERWYSTGRSIELDPARMVRAGEYKGFEVWADRERAPRTLYLAATRGGTLLVPYSRTRPNLRNLVAR